MNFAWRDGYDWHFWWMFPLDGYRMIVILAVIFFSHPRFLARPCQGAWISKKEMKEAAN